jgi:hypothetical protein
MNCVVCSGTSEGELCLSCATEAPVVARPKAPAAPVSRLPKRTLLLAGGAVVTLVVVGLLVAQFASGERPRAETIATGLSALQASSASAQDDAVTGIHTVQGETADAATHRMLGTMAAIVRHHNATNAAIAAHLHDLDLAHLLAPANLIDDAARLRGHAAIAEWQASLGAFAQNESDAWASTTALTDSLPAGMQVGSRDAYGIARHARDESLSRWLKAEKEAAEITEQLLLAVDAAPGMIAVREGMLDLPPELRRQFQRAEARLATLAEVGAGEKGAIERLASTGDMQMSRLPDRWPRDDTAANGTLALARALNGSTTASPLPSPVLVAVHSAAPLHAVIPTLHVVQWHHDKDTQDILAKLASFDREAAMAPAALADPARRATTRGAITTARANLKLLVAERQHYIDAVKGVVSTLPADIRAEPYRTLDDASAHDTATGAFITANEAQLNDMSAMLDFADIHTGGMQMRGGKLDLPDSLRDPYESLQARFAADARRGRNASDALATSDKVVIAKVEQAFAGSGLAYRH